jgi:hypothetical protein
MEKQTAQNKNVAAHHGGGPDRQGGAQQGTGARGEQYLDGPARSHTIARRILFGISKARTQISNLKIENPLLLSTRFFEASAPLQKPGQAREP